MNAVNAHRAIKLLVALGKRKRRQGDESWEAGAATEATITAREQFDWAEFVLIKIQPVAQFRRR